MKNIQEVLKDINVICEKLRTKRELYGDTAWINGEENIKLYAKMCDILPEDPDIKEEMEKFFSEHLKFDAEAIRHLFEEKYFPVITEEKK